VGGDGSQSQGGSNKVTSSGGKDTSTVSKPAITKFPFYLNNDLRVTNVLMYDGAFIENASFDAHQDVFAIRVENVSDKDLQLARIYVTTDKRKGFFEITALPAGKAVVALEKNATGFLEGEKILNIEIEKMSFYPEKLSLYKDDLKLTGRNGGILVENISGKDMENDAYIYYKHTDGNGDFVGGATFRTKLSSLKKGGSVQVAASAFFEKYSKVVFVQYVPK
jgi:hypothetical protein